MHCLVSTEYQKEDLTYTRLKGKVGYGGPGRVEKIYYLTYE